METLVELLQDSHARFAGRTALSMRVGLREDAWTYSRLWRGALAAARFFSDDAGLNAGDRLIIWHPNTPQVVALMFGALLSKVVLVPLDPSSTPEFVSRVIDSTQATAIVTGFPMPVRSPCPSACRVYRPDDIPLDGAAEPTTNRPAPDDIAQIVFTSGTTGDPKGVVLTHRNIVASIQSVRSLLPDDPNYRLLSLLPLSHMLEQTVGLYLPLLFGAAVYYPASRQSSVLVRTLRQRRITTIVLVPRVLDLLLQGIEREARTRGSWGRWQQAHRIARHVPFALRRHLFRAVHRQFGGCLDYVISGGAPLDPALAMTWERMGVRVIQGYGTTECAPIIATNTYWSRVQGTVGRAAPSVSVRISSDGELQVRGANVTPGYWHDDAKTRSTFTEDGWYRTGDLATIDREGRIALLGRLKDLIVLPSGLKVHPEDVENELRAEPGIVDCVVLSRPDAAQTIRVHAVIIADDMSDDPTARHERLAKAVHDANQRLATHQHISSFTEWTQGDFPRTNLQKVKRHEVSACLEGQVSAAQPTPSPATTRELTAIRILLEKVGASRDAPLTPDTSLSNDLNLDSLARVELAVLLENEFGVWVDDSSIGTVETVGDLLEMLATSPSTQPAIPFPRWPRRPTWIALRARIQAAVLFPLYRLLCRPFRVTGLDNLRDVTPPFLLIANHTSHLDTPSILTALPAQLRRRVAVAAAADYFYRSKPIGATASLVLNTFPFSRDEAVRSSLEQCGELVDDGWSILIYPEGTRSTDGRLQPFRRGIGLLATGLRIPVVPIALTGTHAILPKGRDLPRPGPVTVRIGVPLMVESSADRGEIVERLQLAISSISESEAPAPSLPEYHPARTDGTSR